MDRKRDENIGEILGGTVENVIIRICQKKWQEYLERMSTGYKKLPLVAYKPKNAICQRLPTAR